MFKILEESRQFSSGARIGFLKNGGSEPHLIITFDTVICKYLGWQNSWPLRLQIGTNDHQGLLRISISTVPNSPVLEMHGEGAKADFGPIPDLCKETKHPRTTEATVFFTEKADRNFIQVKLPKWEENLPNYNDVKESVTRKVPRSVGPKVIFEPYPVLIYGGNELPLYEFQAALLEPLTHTIGGIFPVNVIIEKGYQALGKPPHPAIQVLMPTEMETLRGKLKTVKLDLKHIKGMGYSLNVMEEKA